ncbi:MAG: hypothetical protein ACREP9_18860, partial [Candidatus Dormibacteraceae bacterium]
MTRPHIASLAVALGLSVVLPSNSAFAEVGLGNWCPQGTCDIATPNVINVYWDSSLAQWDTDVRAAPPVGGAIGTGNGTGFGSFQMTHANIDFLTQSLIHSEYFKLLQQYSVR